MGNDGASDSISALYDSLSSLFFDRSGVTAVWQLCNEARVAAQRASLTSVANHLHTLYRNDSVNRQQIVFLTTLVIAMAGCGLLSSLIRRRRSSEETRPPRPSMRKSSTKSSMKTLVSSSDDDYEDEDDDSKGSLLGPDSLHKATEWSSEPQQQSSHGKMICTSML